MRNSREKNFNSSSAKASRGHRVAVDVGIELGAKKLPSTM